ncbi:MAG: pilus assembly protein TadG-related protein [Acidimicrobiia bacterium]
MRSERGTATLWVLGLCVALMFLGGLAVDLWRAIATRRELSAMADAVATASANGVDEQALRQGTVQLDPARARAIANETLARDARVAGLTAIEVEVTGDEVAVALEDEVPFSLLGIFVRGDPFTARATATAHPELRP